MSMHCFIERQDLLQEHRMRYQRLSVGAIDIILLKNLKLKKGHNSKTTAFRVMLLVLHLHLVMMSNSMFGADTLSTF